MPRLRIPNSARSRYQAKDMLKTDIHCGTAAIRQSPRTCGATRASLPRASSCSRRSAASSCLLRSISGTACHQRRSCGDVTHRQICPRALAAQISSHLANPWCVANLRSVNEVIEIALGLILSLLGGCAAADRALLALAPDQLRDRTSPAAGRGAPKNQDSKQPQPRPQLCWPARQSLLCRHGDYRRRNPQGS